MKRPSRISYVRYPITYICPYMFFKYNLWIGSGFLYYLFGQIKYIYGRTQTSRQFIIKSEPVRGKRKNKKEPWLADEIVTYEAEIFNEPINYLDEGGQWQPIDNTIEEILPGDIGLTEEDDPADFNFAYTTQQNAWKTYFPKYANQAIRVEYEQRIIEYRLNNANPDSLAQIDGNKITYPEVFENVDVVYTITNDVVKEDIVIKQPTDLEQGISYQLKIANVNFKKEDNGDINFYDDITNELIWNMQRPFAEDFIGQQAQGEYLVTQQDEDTYLIKLTANQEVSFFDPRIVYPLVIDPTIGVRVEDSESSYHDGYVTYNGATYADDNTATTAYFGVYSTDTSKAYFDYDTYRLFVEAN